MLFFVISGYVIGLTNQQPWSWNRCGNYWLRRLTRLYPLYFLAVIFSQCVAWELGQPVGLNDFLRHFIFLQSFDFYGSWNLSPIWTNHPLWTLNHELFYYTAFLLIWKLKPKAVPVIGICVIIACMAPFLPGGFRFIGAYAAGFVFWLAGLMMAWMTSSPRENIPRRYPLAALLFLLVATHHAYPGRALLAFLGNYDERLTFVSIADFWMLPVCILLVGGATRSIPNPSKIMRFVCVLPPLLTLIGVVATGHSLLEPRWACVSFCTAAGTALLWGDVGSSILSRISVFGGISYAFYLFHEPMIKLFRHLVPGREITAALITFSVTIALSWLLEKKIQPLFTHRTKPVPSL